MSNMTAFYLERAAECATDARAATLDNVRERCERAEAAWRAMADRLVRTEQMRAARTAEKA